MNENICYFYYRDANRKPIVTIAYRRNLKENAVLFGAAFCRKGDQFTKREGRARAEARLNYVPVAIALSGPDLPRFDVHDSILQYLENVYEYSPRTFFVKQPHGHEGCDEYRKARMPKHAVVQDFEYESQMTMSGT